MLSALTHVFAPSHPWLSELPGSLRPIAPRFALLSELWDSHFLATSHLPGVVGAPILLWGRGQIHSPCGVWVGAGMRGAGGTWAALLHVNMAGVGPASQSSSPACPGAQALGKDGAQDSRVQAACASLGTAGSLITIHHPLHTQPRPEPGVATLLQSMSQAMALKSSGCCTV